MKNHKKLAIMVKLGTMPEAMVGESRIFFVDEKARPAGRLTLAGTIRNGGGTSAHSMRVLGQFALVLMVGGRGFYADARGKKYEIAPGDAILVLPELPHAYGPRSQETESSTWDEIYVCFDGPLFELWRREGMLDDTRLVRSVDDWQTVYNHLRFLCEAPRPANTRQHAEQLRAMLMILEEVFPPCESGNIEPEWLGRARALLESNLDHSYTGQEAARVAQMSYESFRRAWKAHTGTTPQKYRDGKRIEAAKALLLNGTMTQGQIARSLGWRDEAHLSRRFRELVGMSARVEKKNSASQ